MRLTPHTLTHDTPTVGRFLWGAAIVFFCAGDAVTTGFGLTLAGVVESHPVSASVLSVGGIAGMVAAKVVVVTIAFAFYRHADPKFRSAIPLSLAMFGGVIVGVNVAVITHALL